MPKLTLEDIDSGKLRCLFYGPVGTGKTTLCTSALLVPEMCPVLYMDVEGGIDSVKTVFKDHWDKVEVWSMVGEKDVRAMEVAMFSPKTPFRTVVLDSLTEFHSILMDVALDDANRSGGTPQIQDYGTVSNRMLKFFRRVRKKKECKVHFLATASESFTEDQMSNALHTEPDIVGQLTQRVPRFFHIVGHLTARIVASKGGDIKKDVRSMQVQPFSRIRAKDRAPKGRLGAVVSDPTMQKLWNAMYLDNEMYQEYLESAESTDVESETQEASSGED